MADATDFSGYIIAPQDFSGLYKLGDTLATQQAARNKAKAEQKASKKLLNQTVENINPKDFMSQTIIDGVTTKKIYGLKSELNDFIAQNPDVDQATLNSMISRQVGNIAYGVQNAKEYKRQIDKGAEENKATAGFDAGKYFTEANKYFQNPDGSVREDIENVDPGQNIYQKIMENGNIWNSDAIHQNLAKLPTSQETNQYTLGDGKTKRSAMVETDYNPSMYEIKYGSGGEFQGFQAKTDHPKDDKGQIIKDADGNPVNILGHSGYDFFMNKPESKGYINQRKREIAAQYNLDPNSTQVENAVRNELWNDVDTSPNRKTGRKEMKSNVTYINTGAGKGKGGDGTGEVRDIHTPAVDIYDAGQGKKDEAIRLIKTTKLSDAEIGNKVGLEAGSITATRQGRGKYVMPLNTEGLDAEFVNRVIDNLPKKSQVVQGKTEVMPYTSNDVAIVKNDKNQWEIYPKDKTTDRKYIIATIPATTLGWKAQPSVKEKRVLVSQEKGKTSQAKTKKGGFAFDRIGE